VTEHARLNQVRIRLPVTEVTLSWDEAQELKRRANEMPGTGRVSEMLLAVGVSSPTLPNRQEIEAIIAVTDAWLAEVDDAPEGIVRLNAVAHAELRWW
jgi:hypothetical protein